jgi:UDPglucose 6-dehydrogenase
LRISVIGTGYLGATHAACMAELGFEVIGLDIDRARIASLSEGHLPFHEPGLAELLRKHIRSGRLRFTTSYPEVGAWADTHFIAVGTPQRLGEHAADLTYVNSAVTSLAETINRDALIVGKSTVPVGTARHLAQVVSTVKATGVDIGLAWNPEFLREGHGVGDTLTPDRIVIGITSTDHEKTLRKVYAAALERGTPFIVTDYETAELTKAAANAFLATKISFINAFSEITEQVGGDITTLADAIGLDHRIGRRFLNAGVGFGGGCLSKDIRALQARAGELGLGDTMRFLSEIDQINLRRRDMVVHLASEMCEPLVGKKITVLGASFKPDSDDVRDSPALNVAATLFDAGAHVTVYDPAANHNASRRFPKLDYTDRLDAAVANAELIMILTEWTEFTALRPQELAALTSTRKIIDGRNILDIREWEDAGWEVASLGRKTQKADEKAPSLLA